MITSFLEKKVKDFDRKAFYILVMQALLMLMAGTLFIRHYAGDAAFVALEAVLAAAYAKVLLVDVRKIQKSDFGKYAIFFSGVAGIVQATWLIDYVNIGGISQFQKFAGVAAAFILFVLVFRIVYGKRYTEAEVLTSDSGIAVVKTGFDLLSFTSAGKSIVETDLVVRKGQKVKVLVAGAFFAGKPRKIAEIS